MNSSDTTSLWIVRKKTRNDISKIEEDQEHVERGSAEWEQLEAKIECLKKKLHRLEFMIYYGAYDE